MRSHRKKRGQEMKVPGLPGMKKSRMKRRKKKSRMKRRRRLEDFALA
jgi:hypothetical protein